MKKSSEKELLTKKRIAWKEYQLLYTISKCQFIEQNLFELLKLKELEKKQALKSQLENLFPNKKSEYKCWYQNGEIVCADFSKIGF